MEDKEVKEYKYCLRCGKPLRKVETRQLGYGKICYGKVKEKRVKKRLFAID